MTAYTGIEIFIRRDTAANWTSNNPVLSDGQLAIETDTDYIKMGDGSTAWTSLGYLVSIPAKSITAAMLADGTDGELITWNSSGVATMVGVGISGQILTSNGPGSAPTMQTLAAASGFAQVTAYNGSGGTLTQLTPVLFQGVNGTDPALVKADSDGSGTMPAHGIVNADILNAATGVIIICGVISGCDTSSWTAGDALYVADTGALTSTIPSNSDDVAQEVARVIYSHATLGQIFVQNRVSGTPLIEGSSLSDVNDNEVITYGSVASAVNNPKLGNAATGNPALISAVGDDTNIDLMLVAKGTGLIKGPAIPISVAMSDAATDLTTGVKWTWYAPFAGEIEAVHAGVTTAPTGAGIIVDIHKGGTTIMTTNKLDIDVSENDTTTAATAAALTTTTFAAGDKFEFEIDQIGSTVAGAGLTATMIVRMT